MTCHYELQRLEQLAVGVVDYVADPSQTAFDRALQLAMEMSSSGEESVLFNCAIGD